MKKSTFGKVGNLGEGEGGNGGDEENTAGLSVFYN
jgi:hypothetical protein